VNNLIERSFENETGGDGMRALREGRGRRGWLAE
jgi:hypothetical protein